MNLKHRNVMGGSKQRDTGLEVNTFCFGGHEISIRCRKSVSKTTNFKLTVQVSKKDLYNSLQGFGGGFESNSDEDDVGAIDGDLDLLGLDIWPAAVRLCQYIAEYPAVAAGKNILELGAGVGLPCLIAAKCGAIKAYISDYDQRVVDHAHVNAKECGLGDVCQGLLLDWKRLEALSQEHLKAYDLVLAADVMYISQIIPDFIRAVDHVLSPENGVVLITHQERNSLVMGSSDIPEVIDMDVSFETFKDIVSSSGFSIRELGTCASEGFPGPMHIIALSRNEAYLQSLHVIDLTKFPSTM